MRKSVWASVYLGLCYLKLLKLLLKKDNFLKSNKHICCELVKVMVTNNNDIKLIKY